MCVIKPRCSFQNQNQNQNLPYFREREMRGTFGFIFTSQKVKCIVCLFLEEKLFCSLEKMTDFTHVSEHDFTVKSILYPPGYYLYTNPRCVQRRSRLEHRTHRGRQSLNLREQAGSVYILFYFFNFIWNYKSEPYTPHMSAID